MFQHFHTGHQFKFAGVALRKIFRSALLIINIHSGFQGMQAGDIQAIRRHINTGYLCAGARHTLGQNATATADVESIAAKQPTELITDIT